MRIIINSDGKVAEESLAYYVCQVMQQGKISEDGKAYCYATSFKNGVIVSAKRTKSGHSFYVDKREMPTDTAADSKRRKAKR